MGTTMDCKVCKQSTATRANKDNYHDHRIPNLERGQATQREQNVFGWIPGNSDPKLQYSYQAQIIIEITLIRITL